LVRWTCSNITPLTLDQWKNGLIGGKYLSEPDLKKLLAVTIERRLFGPTHGAPNL
jgi:hypothetical protein